MDNLFPSLLMIILRTLLEKVVIQRLADLEKQRHCYPLLVEDFV